MELGIIGQGKIGGTFALQCVEKGIRVVGKAGEPRPELSEKGVKLVQEYNEFADSLRPPRVVFLSLPAGSTVDKVLKELVPHLERAR